MYRWKKCTEHYVCFPLKKLGDMWYCKLLLAGLQSCERNVSTWGT